MQIVTDTLTGDVRAGPKVCNTLDNPIYCSWPSSGNELNITKSNNPPPLTSFTISGTISGPTASGLVLQNNGTDDLVVSSGSTSFEFATPVAYGSGYNVTVATQPVGLTCTVGNDTGTNVTANVTDVQVTCAPAVGEALGGGVVYQISGSTAYVVSLVDVSISVLWDTNVPPTSVATDNSSGYVNTYTTLAATNFTAAAACRTYNPGVGSGEWFLPAQNQWSILGNTDVLNAIDAKSATTGFTQFTVGAAYWSSTQANSELIFVQYFFLVWQLRDPKHEG